MCVEWRKFDIGYGRAMRIETFKASDYYLLDLEKNTGLDVWMRENQILFALMNLQNQKCTRSLWCDKKLYAIFGVVEIRLGVGEVFFMASRGWQKKKKSVCKFVKRDLDAIIPLFSRIQMACLEDDIFLRFAGFFGFEKEGSLKQYDQFGRTYSMLAITGRGK